MLPQDIRAVGVEEVGLDFNVRFALRKTYRCGELAWSPVWSLFSDSCACLAWGSMRLAGLLGALPCLPCLRPLHAPTPHPSSPARSYDIHLGAVADPFTHRFHHHPRRPDRLSLGAMAEAAALLVGTHDFSNFANVSADGARKSPIKTILRYELLPLEGGVRWAGGAAAWACLGCLGGACPGSVPIGLPPAADRHMNRAHAMPVPPCSNSTPACPCLLARRLEVEGTGFLYKQVRHMTGALLAVGSGQLSSGAVAEALAAGARVKSGQERHAYRGWMVAEAKGLCLQEVVYAPYSSLPLPPPPLAP